jgi:hypothetical protein
VLQELNKNVLLETNKYVQIITEDLVGLHTVLYARKSYAPKLKGLASTKLKLGWAG